VKFSLESSTPAHEEGSGAARDTIRRCRFVSLAMRFGPNACQAGLLAGPVQLAPPSPRGGFGIDIVKGAVQVTFGVEIHPHLQFRFLLQRLLRNRGRDFVGFGDRTIGRYFRERDIGNQDAVIRAAEGVFHGKSVTVDGIEADRLYRAVGLQKLANALNRGYGRGGKAGRGGGAARADGGGSHENARVQDHGVVPLRLSVETGCVRNIVHDVSPKEAMLLWRRG